MKILAYLSVLLTALLALGLTACGGTSESSHDDSSSTVSEAPKIIELSAATVQTIADNIDDLTLDDDLTITISRDNLSAENPSIRYEVLQNGKKCATVSVTSESPNHASLFTVRWSYADLDVTLNQSLLKTTMKLLQCAWPEYNDQNLIALAENVTLTAEHIDKIIPYNVVETANAENGGYISIGTNSGTVIITVSYPVAQ